jgi:outer membrane protein assembly factor BamB
MLAHKSIAAAALILFCLPAWATDWPCWRNTNRDATSAEQINTDWTAKPPVLAWSKEVGYAPWVPYPESVANGYASPCVVGNNLYIMGRDGFEIDPNGKDAVYCLNAATGAQIWKYTYANPYIYKTPYLSPNATPNVQGGVVYTVSRNGHVFALNATTGAKIWDNDLSVTPGVAVHNHWGAGSSAVIEGNLVILNLGRRGVALDKTTGAIVWHNEQNTGGYPLNAACFSTPLPFTAPDSTRGVMIFTGLSLEAVNPLTGASMWSISRPGNDSQNIIDPLVVGDKVYISSSYNSGCSVYQFTATSGSLIYNSSAHSDNCAMGVLKNGYYYNYDDSVGAFDCVEYATGVRKWRQTCNRSQAMMAGGKIVTIDEIGALTMIEPTPTAYTQLNRNTTVVTKTYNGAFWSPPIFSGGRLYARSATGQLVCVDLSPPPSSIIYGDANGDGGFSLADINQMVDWLLVRTAPPASGSAKFTACDVNGDGILSLADLNLFVDRLLGRITKFPVEP